MGHDVRILGDRGAGDAGAEYRGTGPDDTGNASGDLWARIRYNRGLHDLVLEADPDLAVGFDVDGFLLPRRRRYPLVLHLKGVAADEARFERGLSRSKLRLLAFLERRNARRADRVVVPSHYSANHAIRAYGLREAKVRVVPEAVDPSPWERLRNDPPPRRDGAPTILTVGRQYPRKNTRTLIRAFSMVTRRVPDALLRVVGDGPELPRLKRQAVSLGLEDRVEFLGALPRMEDV
ncbi:MAG: glycosyltransferase family 4 protein, partial [Gemmatimonadota bacterium]